MTAAVLAVGISLAVAPAAQAADPVPVAGVGFVDRPNLTPKVVEQFSELVEDPEVVNYLFDTLDRL